MCDKIASLMHMVRTDCLLDSVGKIVLSNSGIQIESLSYTTLKGGLQMVWKLNEK